MQVSLYPQQYHMSILHKQEKLIIEGDIFLEICDKDKAPIVFKV